MPVDGSLMASSQHTFRAGELEEGPEESELQDADRALGEIILGPVVGTSVMAADAAVSACLLALWCACSGGRGCDSPHWWVEAPGPLKDRVLLMA